MATYYAQLDDNNIVTQVIVADKSFVDSIGGKWEETFYDGEQKFNYAGVGYGWDGTGFFPPQCHPEAVLNGEYLWDCSNEAHQIKEITE